MIFTFWGRVELEANRMKGRKDMEKKRSMGTKGLDVEKEEEIDLKHGGMEKKQRIDIEMKQGGETGLIAKEVNCEITKGSNKRKQKKDKTKSDRKEKTRW